MTPRQNPGNALLFGSIALVATLTLAACSKNEAPVPTEQAPFLDSSPAAAVSAAGHQPPVSPEGSAAANSAAAAPPAPRMVPYTTTPENRLGKLAAGLGIPVGQRAPDAELQDEEGHAVRLADVLDRRPTLLVFYRGGWCPYCSFEIHELTSHFAEYQRRGVTPVAVSVDRAEEVSKRRATFKIPFPVLSDPDLHVHEAFHVVHKADDAEFGKLKQYGIDLERASGRAHHSYAVPSLFLIDRAGRVRWAHAVPDYKVRPGTSQILAAIDAARL